MNQVLVVGTGAGGASAARALQGPMQVTMLEAGGEFRRLRLGIPSVERLHRTRLPIPAWAIPLIYQPMQVRTTPDMMLVNGTGVGGTTTIATGNGVRMDADLRALGIDLDPEFEQVYADIPVTTNHQRQWRDSTRGLFEIAATMGLEARPMPKMGVAERCVHCGRCVLGCPTGAKWDSRAFVRDALARGAGLRTRTVVERLVVADGRATGVVARENWRRRFYPADTVVLAAGGLGTPSILERSGIRSDPTLFVDPVLCVAGLVPEIRAFDEIAMPFVIQQDRYILSPYFDYLSFLLDRRWWHPAADIVSVMVKLADDTEGAIEGRRIRKALTADDRLRLGKALAVATEMVERIGVPKGKTFTGLVNAGHPGGMLPLTRDQAASLHDDRLPSNVYVADATLLPRALGNPPILTVVALATRIAALIRDRFEAS